MNELLNKMMIFLYRIPWIKEFWSSRFSALESDTIPWTPLEKPLPQCKIALITTGGVHLKTDRPFDMEDKNGDPSYRKISSTATQNDLAITHIYYDHSDADKDINLVFPIDILREVQNAGLVGESAEFFYGFMGHIDAHHVQTLVEQTAKSVARQLKQAEVDIALLVPA